MATHFQMPVVIVLTIPFGRYGILSHPADMLKRVRGNIRIRSRISLGDSVCHCPVLTV